MCLVFYFYLYLVFQIYAHNSALCILHDVFLVLEALTTYREISVLIWYLVILLWSKFQSASNQRLLLLAHENSAAPLPPSRDATIRHYVV